MLASIAEEIQKRSGQGNQANRGSKWKKKCFEKFEKKEKNQVGLEFCVKKAMSLPLPLLECLSVFSKKGGLNIHVTCTHENILLSGRYIKLSREMSQTPWAMDGKSMREGSVQCHIANKIKEVVFGSSEAILHSAGREDIDVRMLGRGRPFIIELVNPKKAISCH